MWHNIYLKQGFNDVKVVPLTSVNPCIIGEGSVYRCIPFSKYHGNKLDGKMFLMRFISGKHRKKKMFLLSENEVKGV